MYDYLGGFTTMCAADIFADEAFSTCHAKVGLALLTCALHG